jgi:hypothetical protein
MSHIIVLSVRVDGVCLDDMTDDAIDALTDSLAFEINCHVSDMLEERDIDNSGMSSNVGVDDKPKRDHAFVALPLAHNDDDPMCALCTTSKSFHRAA